MTVGVCWICQNTAPLTSEHKFKASDLRSEFGKEKMTKLVRGTGLNGLEPLQGVKSRKAKFRSSICVTCNGSLTQDADNAYSKFIKLFPQGAKTEKDLYSVFEEQPYSSTNSKELINLFRFFGKILGCHVVENGLSVPEHLRSFVACEHNNVCIDLELGFDEFSQEVTDLLTSAGDVSGYIAHGGLTVQCDRVSAQPNSYETSYTVGKVKLTFWHNLNEVYLQSYYYEGSNLFDLTRNALKRDGFIE